MGALKRTIPRQKPQDGGAANRKYSNTEIGSVDQITAGLKVIDLTGDTDVATANIRNGEALPLIKQTRKLHQRFISNTASTITKLKLEGVNISEEAISNMYKLLEGDLHKPWIILENPTKTHNLSYEEMIAETKTLRWLRKQLSEADLLLEDVVVVDVFPLVTNHDFLSLPDTTERAKVTALSFSITTDLFEIYRPTRCFSLQCASRYHPDPEKPKPRGRFEDGISQLLASQIDFLSTLKTGDSLKGINLMIWNRPLHLIKGVHPIYIKCYVGRHTRGTLGRQLLYKAAFRESCRFEYTVRPSECPAEYQTRYATSVSFGSVLSDTNRSTERTPPPLPGSRYQLRSMQHANESVVRIAKDKEEQKTAEIIELGSKVRQETLDAMVTRLKNLNIDLTAKSIDKGDGSKKPAITIVAGAASADSLASIDDDVSIIAIKPVTRAMTASQRA